jgi:hypothetical protein
MSTTNEAASDSLPPYSRTAAAESSAPSEFDKPPASDVQGAAALTAPQAPPLQAYGQLTPSVYTQRVFQVVIDKPPMVQDVHRLGVNVVLDAPLNHQFSSGDVVQGYVKITVPPEHGPTALRSFSVRLYGRSFSHVWWKSGSSTHHDRRRQDVFPTYEIVLVGCVWNERFLDSHPDMQFNPGQYEYRFAFNLPEFLVPSFKTRGPWCEFSTKYGLEVTAYDRKFGPVVCEEVIVIFCKTLPGLYSHLKLSSTSI